MKREEEKEQEEVEEGPREESSKTESIREPAANQGHIGLTLDKGVWEAVQVV